MGHRDARTGMAERALAVMLYFPAAHLAQVTRLLAPPDLDRAGFGCHRHLPGTAVHFARVICSVDRAASARLD